MPLGRDSIRLNPERIDKEFESVLTVVEGIEEQTHDIVVENIFPFVEPRAHLARPLFTDEHGVEILVVVAQIRGCLAADRRSVTRLPLPETSDPNHLGHRGARGEIFKRRRAGDTRDM